MEFFKLYKSKIQFMTMKGLKIVISSAIYRRTKDRKRTFSSYLVKITNSATVSSRKSIILGVPDFPSNHRWHGFWALRKLVSSPLLIFNQEFTKKFALSWTMSTIFTDWISTLLRPEFYSRFFTLFGLLFIALLSVCSASKGWDLSSGMRAELRGGRVRLQEACGIKTKTQ